MHLVISAVFWLIAALVIEVVTSIVHFIEAAWPFLLVTAVLAGFIFYFARDRSQSAPWGRNDAAPEGTSTLTSSIAVPTVHDEALTRNLLGSPRNDAQDEYAPKAPWNAPISRPISSGHVTTPGSWQSRAVVCPPTRGLVIIDRALEKILDGRKTMELRRKHNRKPGPIALIRKGSGQIFGVAEVYESVGPMNFVQFCSMAHEHAVEPDRLQEVFAQGWVFGWRLRNVIRLQTPVRYVHKGMSQVNLDAEAVGELRRSLAGH